MSLAASELGRKLLESASTFDAADSNTLQHLPKHLAEAGETAPLVALVSTGPQWMEAKRSRFGSDFSYQQDLLLAFQNVAASVSDTALVDFTRVVTPIVYLNARSFNYSDKYIQALVWLDKRAMALDYARLRPALAKRFESIRVVHATSERIGTRSRELLDELHDTAQLLTASDVRDKAFVYLAQATAGVGDIVSSETYAGSIADGGARDEAFASLAEALLRLCDWRAAELVIEQIAFGGKRSLLRSHLASTLANLGHFLEAENVALSLRSPRRRLFALRHLAAALNRVNGAAAARPTILRIEREIASINVSVRQLQEIQDFWPTLHAVGGLEEIKHSYATTTRAIQELPDAALQAQLCRRQAHVMFALGEREAAKDNLQQALVYAESVGDAQRQAALFTAIGETSFHCGYRNLSEEAFNSSRLSSVGIKDKGWLDFELAQLARAAAACGNDLAYAAMNGIASRPMRREVALDLIPLLVRNEATHAAELLLRGVEEDVIGSAVTAAPPAYRDEVLRRISRTLAVTASEDRATAVIECITDPIIRIQALLENCSRASATKQPDDVMASIIAAGRAVVAETAEGPRKDKARVALAKSLAGCQQVAEAMEVLEFIVEPATRRQAEVLLVEVVSGYSPERALRLLQQISSMGSDQDHDEPERLFKIAAAYLSLGSLQGAMSLVHSVRDCDDRILFVGRLGLRASSTSPVLALRLIAQFRRSLGLVTDSGKKESGRALLIRAFLACGLRKRAAMEILRAPTPSLPGGGLSWTSQLSLVAQVLRDYGGRRFAIAILESVLKEVSESRQSGERSRTLMLLSEAFLELGALAESEKALSDAVDAARRCSLPKNVISLLRAADILARRGEAERSLILTEEGFNLATAGPSDSTNGALKALATYCIGKGISELGFRALAHLDDPDFLLYCLSEVALATDGSERGTLSSFLVEAIRILGWDRDEWRRVYSAISGGQCSTKLDLAV